MSLTTWFWPKCIFLCFISTDNHDCFHTTAKCVFWILIRDAHFELKFKIRKKTVCMPNHVAKRNLKCASQITVQRCFPVTILANHATKSVYEWLDLRIVFWGAELVWPSNHFHYNTARCTCKGNVNNTRACLIGRQPRHSHVSSPRSRKENHIFGHSCV